MELIKYSALFLIFFAHSGNLTNDLNPILEAMPEICDNAIDDDMDGDVDLNDDDCVCFTELPSSLIPNPSFEERSCCPTSYAQLNCADDWIQASVPTTDYLNTCGFLGDFDQAPLPFPDGNGAIGFRDGRPPAQPNFKEYTGAVLTSPLKAGSLYLLEMFVGFSSAVTSPPFDITVFGSTDVNALPFGGNNANFGCPTNGQGWEQLGTETISGLNEWKLVKFSFTPSDAFRSFVVGPNCSTSNFSTSNAHYYFFDRLILAEFGEFGFDVPEVSGHECENDLVLGVDSEPDLTYQWFYNGIAVVGETGSHFDVPNGVAGEGEYQLIITDQVGCRTSKPYEVFIETFQSTETIQLCENDSILLGGNWIKESMVFQIDTFSRNGCDSLATIIVEIEPLDTTFISKVICIGDEFSFGDQILSTAGEFERIVPSPGCDSVYVLNLDIQPPLTQAFSNDTLFVELGDQIDIQSGADYSLIQSYIWTNDTEIFCSDCEVFTFIPLVDQIVYFDAMDLNGCNINGRTHLRVEKDYEVYIPNIFTPNQDNINDAFRIYADNEVEIVQMFQVFNRWGGLVHESSQFAPDDVIGHWLGEFGGQPAAAGVYTYVLKVKYLDQVEKSFFGDVTLIR